MINNKMLTSFSIFLGVLYLSGLVFFGEKLLYSQNIKLILLISPGASLIATPLICRHANKLKHRAGAIILSICIGVAGSLYGIFSSIQPSGFLVDQFVVLSQFSTIIFILVMIGLKNINRN